MELLLLLTLAQRDNKQVSARSLISDSNVVCSRRPWNKIKEPTATVRPAVKLEGDFYSPVPANPHLGISDENKISGVFNKKIFDYQFYR